MRQVDYNSQRNNDSFKGLFSGNKQCFTTCAWMFISYYSNYDGTNDQQLTKYFDDVENSVGSKGIGEKIKAKYNWISGKTSYWGLVQEAGIQKYLPNHKIKFDTKFPLAQLHGLVTNGPVLISTKKLGGLRGGHIILLVDNWQIGHISQKGFYVHDPYGNANSNYRDHNGKNVIYTDTYLNRHIDKGNGICWVLYNSSITGG